jgi:hypothetical protein
VPSERALEDVVDRRIRIFIGTADNLAPADPRRAYVERMRLGRDIQLTECSGVRHLFDDLDFRPPRYAAQIQTARRCRLEESANGEIVNSKTKRAFSFNNARAVDAGMQRSRQRGNTSVRLLADLKETLSTLHF